MNRCALALMFLCGLVLSGCAREREYFSNHNPITDTALFIGSFFDSTDPTDLSQIKHSSDDKPAEIRPL
jgi:hypothetical protein